MTMPPQPGPWGPGGQGDGSQQPPQGYSPQQFPQQPQWGPPRQPPPPPQGDAVKWLLGAVAVLLVIGITVGVTVLVTRNDSGGTGPTETSPTGPPIASADDDGPVEIIVADPTCSTWTPLAGALGTAESNGWTSADRKLARTEWSSAQTAQFEAVGNAMRKTADQAVTLARQTPHRVMRELYEQFIYFGRAYADAVSNYVPQDDGLARANVGASTSISAICDAVSNGAVLSRSAPAPADPPTEVRPVGDPAQPEQFISEGDSICEDWIRGSEQFNVDIDDWIGLDPNVSATQWTPEQRTTRENGDRVLDDYSTHMTTLADASGNPALADFANLAAQYFRAYVTTTESYIATDNYLVVPGLRLNNLVTNSCKAATR